jgi:hypothetical protein
MPSAISALIACADHWHQRESIEYLQIIDPAIEYCPGELASSESLH